MTIISMRLKKQIAILLSKGLTLCSQHGCLIFIFNVIAADHHRNIRIHAVLNVHTYSLSKAH